MAARPRRKKSSAVFVSPGTRDLLLTPDEDATDILERKRYKLEYQTDGGKHGTILFATRSPRSSKTARSFAIKQQVVRSPINVSDRAYREARILRALGKLKNSEYYPSGVSNFVDLIEDFRGFDNEQRVVGFVLERADSTLFGIRELGMSVNEFREVVFQILFALHVAQTSYEFMHNDFHLKNVLVVLPASRPPSAQRVHFKLGQKSWAINGYLIKIADFGLSRMRLVDGGGKEEVVYDKKHKAFRVFLRTKDVQSALEALGQIKINAATWVSDDALTTTLSPTSRLAQRAELTDVARRQWLDLKRLCRNDEALPKLLSHPFFEPLRAPLPAAASSPPVIRKRKLSFRLASEDPEEGDDEVVKEEEKKEPLKKEPPKKEKAATSNPATFTSTATSTSTNTQKPPRPRGRPRKAIIPNQVLKVAPTNPNPLPTLNATKALKFQPKPNPVKPNPTQVSKLSKPSLKPAKSPLKQVAPKRVALKVAPKVAQKAVPAANVAPQRQRSSGPPPTKKRRLVIVD